MKEVENPVVYVAFSNPNLMDAVPQNVSEGPPQFMPEIGKPLNGGDAAFVGPPVGSPKFLQSVEHWHILGILLVEDTISPRHTASARRYHNIAIAAKGFSGVRPGALHLPSTEKGRAPGWEAAPVSSGL